jgi:hypothetical protein
MTKQKSPSAERLVRRAAVRNRAGRLTLTCAAALRLAEQHRLSPAQIGQICDRAGIRIGKCRLGCFQ